MTHMLFKTVSIFLLLSFGLQTQAFSPEGWGQNGDQCDAYDQLPLSQLPPLFPSSAKYSSQLQTEYIAYLGHLRTGAQPSAYTSVFQKEEAIALIEDREWMSHLLQAVGKSLGAGTEEYQRPVQDRLRGLLLKDGKIDKEESQFLLFLSDISQRGEAIWDYVRVFEMGEDPRYDIEIETRLGLFLGQKYEKSPLGQLGGKEYLNPYHEMAKKIALDPIMQGRVLRGPNEEISLDLANLPFSEREHIKMYGDAFLAKVLVEHPLKKNSPVGLEGAHTFNSNPILIVPFNEAVEDADWASLSVWPIFPLNKDIDFDEAVHDPKEYPVHARAVRRGIRMSLSEFHVARWHSLYGLSSNWNWFCSAYNATNPSGHGLVSQIESEVRSRYKCSCRALGIESITEPSLKKSLASVWRGLAYRSGLSSHVQLNQPDQVLLMLSKVKFENAEEIRAQDYLIQRLSLMTENCEFERKDEEDEENTQRNVGEVVSDLLASLPHTEKKTLEPVGQAELPDQGTEGDRSDDEAEEDGGTEWTEFPDGGVKPPKAANDNEPGSQDIDIAAMETTLKMALHYYQKGFLLEMIDKVLLDIDPRVAVAAGAGAYLSQPYIKQALEKARSLNSRLLKTSHVGPRGARHFVASAAFAVLGLGPAVASDAIANDVHQELERLKNDSPVAFALTLNGMNEVLEEGRFRDVIDEHSIVREFYFRLTLKIRDDLAL